VGGGERGSGRKGTEGERMGGGKGGRGRGEGRVGRGFRGVSVGIGVEVCAGEGDE